MKNKISITLFIIALLGFSCEKAADDDSQSVNNKPITISVHIQELDPGGHYMGSGPAYVECGVSWTGYLFGGFNSMTDSDGNISKTINSKGNEAHCEVLKVTCNGRDYWIDDDFARHMVSVQPGETGHITIRLN